MLLTELFEMFRFIKHRLGIGQHSDQSLLCQGLLVHDFKIIGGVCFLQILGDGAVAGSQGWNESIKVRGIKRVGVRGWGS